MFQQSPRPYHFLKDFTGFDSSSSSVVVYGWLQMSKFHWRQFVFSDILLTPWAVIFKQ